MNKHRASRTLAFTLVELLVVIAVISLLAAMTLPTIRGIVREQKVTRTAGSISAYFEVARARAIATGQPYGIVVERVATDAQQANTDRFRSVRLRYCSSPLTYSGDNGQARASVAQEATRATADGRNNFYGLVDFNDADNVTPFPTSVSLVVHAAQVASGQSTVAGHTSAIQPGTTLYMGDSDYPLEIANISFPNRPAFPMGHLIPQMLVRVPPDAVQLFNKSLGQQQSFRLELAPQETSESPLELTDGVSIDLTYSGFGRGGDDFSPYAILADRRWSELDTNLANNSLYDFESIMILFNGQGRVSQVRAGSFYWDRANNEVNAFTQTRQEAISDVHFCIARSEHIHPDDPFPATDGSDGPSSLFSGESLWLSIGSASGEITVSGSDPITGTERSSIATAYATNPNLAFATAIAASRKSAVGAE